MELSTFCHRFAGVRSELNDNGNICGTVCDAGKPVISSRNYSVSRVYSQPSCLTFSTRDLCLITVCLVGPQGFLNLQFQPWLRNLLTRSVAIVPSLVVALIGGSAGAGKLIILSSVSPRDLSSAGFVWMCDSVISLLPS